MKKKYILASLIILVVVLIIIFSSQLAPLFKNTEKIKGFILSFGNFAPVIFIFLVIIQVFIAPIPGQAVGIVSGYVFGTFKGTLYSMIGLIIGSWLIFLLSRKLGRPFVEKLVKKDSLKKFDKIVQKNGTFTLFLIFLLPFFPDDIICYLAGLTKIKIRTLVLVSAIGRFPGFLVLNLVGSGIASPNQKLSIIIFVSVLVVSFIIYLLRDKIEKFMHNLFRSGKSYI